MRKLHLMAAPSLMFHVLESFRRSLLLEARFESVHSMGSLAPERSLLRQSPWEDGSQRVKGSGYQKVQAVGSVVLSTTGRVRLITGTHHLIKYT